MIALCVLNTMLPHLSLYLRYWENEVHFSSARITFHSVYIYSLFQTQSSALLHASPELVQCAFILCRWKSSNFRWMGKCITPANRCTLKSLWWDHFKKCKIRPTTVNPFWKYSMCTPKKSLLSIEMQSKLFLEWTVYRDSGLRKMPDMYSVRVVFHTRLTGP